MEIKDIILKINQLVPEATPHNMLETRLKVTESGIEELPPEIIGAVKSAFLRIVQGLSEEKFDEFLQYLIALEYHKNITQGLHATQMPVAFDHLPQKNLLFEINFPDDLRGWADPDQNPEGLDNDDFQL